MVNVRKNSTPTERYALGCAFTTTLAAWSFDSGLLGLGTMIVVAMAGVLPLAIRDIVKEVMGK